MTVRLRTTDSSSTFRALISVVDRMSRALADELAAEAGMPLDRYEILLILAQAEDGAMRPSELAERRHLSRSGATRLIDRLEGDGLIERRSYDNDRRGTLLVMTAEGEAAFRSAGRVHLSGLERHVGAVLTGDEMAELQRLLGKLDEGMDSAHP